MSDVDRLMAIATGSDKPVVNFDSYSDWIGTQEKEKEPVDLRKGYADYLRETYIKAEAYDPQIENEIQTGLYGSLVKDGVLKEGDLESYQSITASPELGLEEKANLFVNTFEIDEDEDSEWRAVSRYLTHAKQTAAGELVETEENTALLEQRRQAAEAIVARREDEMKRMAVDNGELAFASVLNEKGQRVVVAGDRALETDLLSGLKQSKLGGVSLADAALAQSELEVPTGFNLPRFKLRRVHEAATGLEELAKKDAFLRTQIAGHAQSMAHAEHDKTDRLEWALDEFGQAATDIFGRLLNIKGYEEARIEREKQYIASDAPISSVVRSLTKRLNSVEGNNYTQDEVMKAYTQIVLNDANQNGRFEFHDGDDEVGKNIRTFGYGAPVVHPAAMANETVFNKMLDARPDINDSVKENLRANRKAFLTESFESTDELLGRSGVADEWHTALMEGRQQGKKNYEILNDFLADEKNFSAWSERAKGVAWSLWDAGAQLVAAVPAAFKAEWAQEVLVDSAQRNSDRRQVAQLFGEDFGFGQDIAETIAPMVTDIAATALLAAATSKAGGVGAAAYHAGKQGARITAKGLIKGLTTSVFREIGEEGIEGAAKNLVKQGLIKESVEDMSGAGSLAAIKAFNGAVAQKIGTTSAVFIPAATRSGGATYGSVFHTLSQDPSLSKEEIHDRALGAALGAGALTGLITATFSAFGRGGVEDALLKGMSFKQAKALFGSLASTEGITDTTFKKVVAEQMKASLKKFQFSTTKGLVKDAFDEAQEEGLDQLLNSFVEDAALHQNTPMLERIQQSFHAAALGGVMGAGATGIRQIGQRIAPNQMERAAQAAQLQQQFVADVTTRLEEVGSPMAAQTVAALLTSKARRRGQYAPPTDDTGGVEGAIAPEPTPQPQDDDSGAAAVEVPPAPELSDDALAAIQTREEKIAELNITPTGRKNAKRAAKQQRQAARLQQEIDFIKRTGELEIPANLEPTPAPAAAQAQPTVPPPTSQPVEETPKTIVDRIQRLPAIDARARVQQAIENMTSDDLFNRQIDMSGVTTEAEGRYAKFSTLFPPAVVEAAESVGIDPMDAAQNNAKHVRFFTPEEAADIEPDPKRVGYTFVPDTERRKAFAIGKKVEFDLKPFREGETAQEEELAEALSAIQTAQQGYPVRFSSGIKYGSAVSNKNMAAKSDFVADVVYSYFPTIELSPEQIAETRASSRKRTFFDPASGKRVTRAIKMPLDENGVGLFTNDPVVVAEMLAHNIPVRVPYGTKDINPAIKPYIKRGYVTDVRMLSKDGTMLESAVVRIEQTSDLKPNNKRFEDIAGVQFIASSPMQGEVESMLLAHSGIGQERNLPDPIGQLFSKQKLELDDEFAAYTTQSSATEFLMLTHLFELRKTLLKPNRRFTVPAPNNRVTVNPSKKKQVIKELSDRLSGAPDLAGTAKMVTPLLNLKSSAKPTHTDAVIQFIDDFVLNNPDFDGNVMPTFDSVFERTFNRYAQQQRERGVNERNKAMVSIDAEATSMSLVDAQQLAAFSEDIGGIDPEDSVVGPTYFNAVVNSVDMAIDAVDTDPMLRDALNDLALKSVYTNPDSGTVNHVQQMSSRDLMSRIGLWMAAGDHATRTDALEFTQMLEEGGFRSGIDLRNALKLTSLFGRIDGDPSADPRVVSELRRQMTESLGEPVSEARAKNFLRAMDGAMRRRLSRAAVSTVLGQDALVHNTSEVARLGLVSGDSDSVIAAIEKIKKSSKSKSHRLVAELLLEDKQFISKVGFSMGISKADIAGEYVRHVNGKHSVFINMQKSNGIGLENVLLEEYVHAFLSDTLAKPEETLNSRQVLARRRLQGLYQMAQQEYRRTADTNTDDFNATLEAGLENMDEFVANFLLDPDFQKFIKTLDTPKGQRGFFARILDAMVSLFRKISPKENALYAAALKDVVDLSKSTMRASAVPFKQQAASAVQEASNRIQEAGRVMTLRTSVMPAPETNAEASLRETYEPQTDEEVKAAERANQNNRSPILSVAAVRLANGQITIEDYARAVDAIDPFVVKGVEKPPSESSIRKYISTAKVDKVGVKVDPETLVEVRIDIPTYTKSVKDGNAVYAVTLHEPVSSTATRVGTPLSYVPMAHLTNVDMRTRAISGKGGAIRIAAGQGKTPLATVAGKLVSTSTIPKDISQYTEVSYNPIRSSEFRDVSNRRVVIGGDEAVSIGSRVYVKNPRYGSEPSGYIDPLTPEADIRYTSIPEAGSAQLISDSQKDLTTEQQQAEFEEVVGFLRERLPYGVRFKHDPNMPAAMGADGDFILINPKILMRGLESFDRLGKRKMVDIMLHEEIGHEASFGALTQAEIDGLVDSLSDEQYAEIASQYYRFNPEQRQQALANLQSENPAVVAEEKFRLAEEKLRMRLQEVTRGFTTEEDAEFWRSKPSLMAILKRYIGGVINKWVANRRLNGASGAMDVALTKVMNEMQAIQLGFSRQPMSKTFNPDLPAESIEEYMRALNADPLSDIEDAQEAAQDLTVLASSAMSVADLIGFLNQANMQMRDAKVLVAKSAGDQEAIEAIPIVKWQTKQVDIDNTFAAGITTLSKAKQLLGFDDKASLRENLEKMFPSVSSMNIVDLEFDIEFYANQLKKETTITLRPTNIMMRYDAESNTFDISPPEYLFYGENYRERGDFAQNIAALIELSRRDQIDPDMGMMINLVLSNEQSVRRDGNTALAKEAILSGEPNFVTGDRPVDRGLLQEVVPSLVEISDRPVFKGVETNLGENSGIDNSAFHEALLGLDDDVVTFEIDRVKRNPLESKEDYLAKFDSDKTDYEIGYRFNYDMFSEERLNSAVDRLLASEGVDFFRSKTDYLTTENSFPDVDFSNMDVEEEMELEAELEDRLVDLKDLAGEENLKGLNAETVEDIYRARRIILKEHEKNAYRPTQKVDFDIKNGTIKIGVMSTRESVQSIPTDFSFSALLMKMLIVNNSTIKAKKITTLAAGDSYSRRQRDITAAAFREFEDGFQLSPEQVASVKKRISSTDIGMNGYYSWPNQGFKIVNYSGDEQFLNPAALDPDDNFRRVRYQASEELERTLSSIPELSALTADQLPSEEVEDFAERQAQKAKEKVEEFVAMLKSNPANPDKLDLFWALHGQDADNAPEQEIKRRRKKASRLWADYGYSVNVEFDLSRGSKSSVAFSKRILESLTRLEKIPELEKVIGDFNAEKAAFMKQIEGRRGTPEDSDALQAIRDKYNERLIDEGITTIKLFTSVGQNAGESNSLDGVDFSSVVQLLEMPMYEYQAYKAPKGWLNRLFMGDVGRPIKQLIDQRNAFNRASSRLVKQYKEKMDKLIAEAYGDPSDADWELIAQAQGYIDGSLLDKDALQKFDDEHMARIDKINQNDQLTPREKQIMRDSSRAKRDKDIETAEDQAIEQAERASDAALTKLGQRSSELAAHIQSMRRDLIQPIQQKLKAAGLSDQIAAKIDRTGGIYITRAYRMFNDPTFAERMRTDPQYADLRNEAMKFFEDELYKNTYNSTYSQTYSRLVDEGVDAGLAKAEAEAKATKKAKKVLRKAHDKAGRGSTAGAAALEAFLDKYSERTGSSPQSAKGLKVLENNLKKRKDVPEVIRRLLGEYGPREGTDLIVRTFATVANVAAQQTFLNNVAEVGKQQGFLVDQATYESARDQYEDYVPLRKGNSTNPNDPLNNLYGPRDMVEAMQDTLNPSFAIDHNSTSEKAVRGLTAIAQKLTGQAMAMKTLGSVGFFLRNALGNFLFFGPAQGFFRVDKMMGRSLMFKRTSLNAEGQRLTDAQVQEYLTELTGLNVIGDELHAGLLRQLLNGEIDPDSALAKVEKAIDEIPVIGKTKQGAIALQNKLAALSAAIDGRYKIAYYENELSTLLEAKRRYPESDIGRMSEYDLKRMAAEKVLMTAQSLSQAPPLAQALTKSGFGMVFAPFIRFKMEVPRIVINTYKLSAREKKSDNPMIRARGKRRFFAMTGVLGGFSAAVPSVLAWLSDIGDEEDEALRKSMPEYLRSHTFFYLRDDKGNLRSVNMTYLNPFSLIVDPFLRSLPKLAKGDVSDAVGQFTKGMIFDTYFDDQILAGSMMDVLKNRNSTTDDPIWIEGVDGLGTSLQKAMTYLYDNSYQPRLLKDMIDAKNATGGDYEGFANSPLGQLLDGAYPVKVHEVDLEKQYRRFIYSHLDRMSAVNKQKYELYSKESFDPDKIDAVYQRELDGKRALNQEMLRVARGFEGLGIAATKQFKLLTERGVGKNRARLLFHGVMDRPEINKKFAAGLVERGYASRLNEMLKARDKRARYLKIE